MLHCKREVSTVHFKCLYWDNTILISIRDWPIMLIFLPVMLCCTAHKIYLLCSRIRIVLSLSSLFIYKFTGISHYLYIADNVKRLFY